MPRLASVGDERNRATSQIAEAVAADARSGKRSEVKMSDKRGIFVVGAARRSGQLSMPGARCKNITRENQPSGQ